MMNTVPQLYSEYRAQVPGQELSWLREQRQLAWEAFSHSGFPSPREEDWRYTPVTPMERKRFQPVALEDHAEVDLPWLASQRITGCWALVLVNGHYRPELSDLEGIPEEILADDLLSALHTHGDLPQPGAHLPESPHGFLSFNTAFFTGGALLRLPAGAILEKPLQILHLCTGNEILANTRNFIELGAGARATVVETHAGLAGTGYLHACVSEAHLQEGAQLDYCKLQREAERAFHFGGLYVRQESGSSLHHHQFNLGGLLARCEVHTRLGEAASCSLQGLFLGNQRQHLDNLVRVSHDQPHGSSVVDYRGILDDQSRGVFQGRIVVPPHAQKTQAEMRNPNLLLSDQAEIDTKPQLEIHADDVKCSHGVTVGQLDEKALFFLRSRGLDLAEARDMLVFAFGNEIVERLAAPTLRDYLRNCLLERAAESLRGHGL
jgi:Fe-S cluster assembly protein SufD